MFVTHCFYNFPNVINIIIIIFGLTLDHFGVDSCMTRIVDEFEGFATVVFVSIAKR